MIALCIKPLPEQVMSNSHAPVLKKILSHVYVYLFTNSFELLFHNIDLNSLNGKVLLCDDC